MSPICSLAESSGTLNTKYEMTISCSSSKECLITFGSITVNVVKSTVPFKTTFQGHFEIFDGIAPGVTHKVHFATEGVMRDKVFVPLITDISIMTRQFSYSTTFKT